PEKPASTGPPKCQIDAWKRFFGIIQHVVIQECFPYRKANIVRQLVDHRVDDLQGFRLSLRSNQEAHINTGQPSPLFAMRLPKAQPYLIDDFVDRAPLPQLTK